MIDRLNYFDIYGYLLPGGLLLTVLWLPFGSISGMWPDDLASAVLGLGLAYLVGHILRIWSQVIISSSFKDGAGESRRPSDLLLDLDGDRVLPGSSHLAASVKRSLQEQMRREFDGLQVHTDTSIAAGVRSRISELEKAIACEGDPRRRNDLNQQLSQLRDEKREIQSNRNAAFFKCRTYLLQKKAAGAEQLQGMYELMRGMATALMLASSLYCGLGIGLVLFDQAKWQAPVFGGRDLILYHYATPICLCLFIVAVFELALAILSMFPRYAERSRFWSYFGIVGLLLLAGSGIGFINGRLVQTIAGKYLNENHSAAVILSAIIVLAIGLFCGSGSRYFAATWVGTVYREFNALAKKPLEKPRSTRQVSVVRRGG